MKGPFAVNGLNRISLAAAPPMSGVASLTWPSLGWAALTMDCDKLSAVILGLDATEAVRVMNELVDINGASARHVAATCIRYARQGLRPKWWGMLYRAGVFENDAIAMTVHVISEFNEAAEQHGVKLPMWQRLAKKVRYIARKVRNVKDSDSQGAARVNH